MLLQKLPTSPPEPSCYVTYAYIHIFMYIKFIIKFKNACMHVYKHLMEIEIIKQIPMKYS